MNFTNLVPSIFYADVNDALKLFIDCLEFRIKHSELGSENSFCVIEKNGLELMLFENKELANEHHPELRLVTKDIEEVYNNVALSHPEFLHPNLNKVTLRPWGAKEFALRDKQLGIRIQQW